MRLTMLRPRSRPHHSQDYRKQRGTRRHDLTQVQDLPVVDDKGTRALDSTGDVPFPEERLKPAQEPGEHQRGKEDPGIVSADKQTESTDPIEGPQKPYRPT